MTQCRISTTQNLAADRGVGVDGVGLSFLGFVDSRFFTIVLLGRVGTDVPTSGPWVPCVP